ncbi:MAG: hypothetical protein ACM30E_04610 [Nitrososphaerales archaeon]
MFMPARSDQIAKVRRNLGAGRVAGQGDTEQGQDHGRSKDAANMAQGPG